MYILNYFAFLATSTTFAKAFISFTAISASIFLFITTFAFFNPLINSLYVIPFKVMMKPRAADFVQDCADILSMANGKGGRFFFPGEENTQRVTRLCSYAQWMAEQMEKEEHQRR